MEEGKALAMPDMPVVAMGFSMLLLQARTQACQVRAGGMRHKPHLEYL